jgi:ribosomal protein S2
VCVCVRQRRGRNIYCIFAHRCNNHLIDTLKTAPTLGSMLKCVSARNAEYENIIEVL